MTGQQVKTFCSEDTLEIHNIQHLGREIIFIMSITTLMSRSRSLEYYLLASVD